MTKVELFEHIRKDYFYHHKSIRQIAKDRHIHRRTVRQAIQNAIPPERKSSQRASKVLTLAHKALIGQWVIEDLSAPKKQRHTGERVFSRLRDEHGYKGAAVTVRNYFYSVRKQHRQPHKVFIPQCHPAGEEAEVDWYEAQVYLAGVQQTVYFFQMRACYSGKEFHRAFLRQNQQCFLEAHVAAFKFFGGVFKTIRYDNLTSAVKKVLQGRKRHETERFSLLRSHYLFDAIFCLPGVEGAHEKGGVEGAVGRFRRAHLVPIPKVASLAALNELLVAACHKDAQRIIHGQRDSVAQRWQAEENLLSALPIELFDTADVTSPLVNDKSLVTVKGNYYSVPTDYVGQTVEARAYAQTVSFYKQGKQIATHARHYERHKMVVELAHYLSLLKHKPGGLRHSVALSQAKEQLRWPAVYNNYWAALKVQHDEHSANRYMVDFLWWAQTYDQQDICQVLEQALECGSLSLDAIQLLMRQHLQPNPSVAPLSENVLGALSDYDRPPSQVSQYDDLLMQPTGASQ